jgi:hypothetical protein
MSATAIESRLAAAIRDPAMPVPEGLTSARGEPDRLRFAVYRNNVHVSLVEALAKAFPVTRRLVGEEFFRAMARAYVALHKPTSPVLIAYGRNFPDFVADFPPAARLAYLPDLARLERAWLHAYHAAEATPLDAGEVLGRAPDKLPGLSFLAHPATALVRSDHAIGSIWAAHQAETVKPVETGRAEAVLVTRPQAEVRATVLPHADIPFVTRLLDQAPLGEAAWQALSADPGFDAGRALRGLLALGAFTQISIRSEGPES